MAKVKTNKRRTRRMPRPAKRVSPTPIMTLSPKEKQLAALLNDPCAADVPSGAVYSGERGIVSRFALEASVALGAGETAGAICFHPNDNSVAIFSAALPTTTFAVSAGNFVQSGGPGSAFLSANAAKIRALAACITAMPNSSSLNATGDISVGNVTLSSLYGAAVSVNQIFSLLTVRSPVVRKNYEVKLVPGGFDDRYAKVIAGGNPSTTGTDDSDTSVVVIAFRGLPAASGLNYRLTTVLEWTPTLNVGLTVTTVASPGVKHEAVTQALHKHHGGWWHNMWESIGSDLGGVASQLATTVVTGGAKLLAKGVTGMLL